MLILVLIKIAGLLSFCGGPLFVADMLKPVLGDAGAFAVGFAPVAIAVACSFSLWEDHPWSWGKWGAVAGSISMAAISAMNVFAISRFMVTPPAPDRGLMILGIAVGSASALVYLWLGLRRLRELTEAG